MGDERRLWLYHRGTLLVGPDRCLMGHIAWLEYTFSKANVYPIMHGSLYGYVQYSAVRAYTAWGDDLFSDEVDYDVLRQVLPMLGKLFPEADVSKVELGTCVGVVGRPARRVISAEALEELAQPAGGKTT